MFGNGTKPWDIALRLNNYRLFLRPVGAHNRRKEMQSTRLRLPSSNECLSKTPERLTDIVSDRSGLDKGSDVDYGYTNP